MREKLSTPTKSVSPPRGLAFVNASHSVFSAGHALKPTSQMSAGASSTHGVNQRLVLTCLPRRSAVGEKLVHAGLRLGKRVLARDRALHRERDLLVEDRAHRVVDLHRREDRKSTRLNSSH